MHGLEAAENARRLLREVWRVLKDDGRLLVVAPNRRGMWAYLESTPVRPGPALFGRPDRRACSPPRCSGWSAATPRLFMPPMRLRPALRSARLWERGGRRMLPPAMAGLTITEASKDMYAAIPVPSKPRHRIAFAEAV